jgi:RNA polymerase sigma-70 factor (ECF subfamily)
LAALENWPEGGIPHQPAAWLLRVAQRKLIDSWRRERRSGALNESNCEPDAVMQDADIPDERLALVFTCCHPALADGARTALTLQAVAGLSVTEIARAFLLREATVAQRLVRAKRKIQGAGIPFRVPGPELWPERIGGVLEVLYLVFNEGHSATAGAAPVRGDLCEEALRLVRLVLELLPQEAEAEGLLALMLASHGRAGGRTAPDGSLITLEHQDRSLWDSQAQVEAERVLDRAQRRRQPGPYQIQAAISALHGAAGSWQATDWAQITLLYKRLYSMLPTPVVRLNAIVAESMLHGPELGLRRLAVLDASGSLERYQPFHATRADLHRRAGQLAEAAAAYGRALELTDNEAQRAYLEARLLEVLA